MALTMSAAMPVAADEAAIIAAWQKWVSNNDVERSSLAVSKDGIVLSEHGIGMDASTPVPLASLSKAITGACVLTLIEEGALAYDTTLGDVLRDRPDVLGNGATITVEQLLTHTSGLDFDRTQTLFNPALWGASDMHDHIASLALGRGVGATDYFYNNENYAVLGSVIMQVTGQSVEDACRPRALHGLQSATPDRRTGGGLAWGGWSMTVADYARFAGRLEVKDDWPGVPLESAYYGPGVLLRDTETGTNIWHFGGYCLLGLGDSGSYFFVLDNGWGVAVSYDICASREQSIALDNALTGAAYSVD